MKKNINKKLNKANSSLDINSIRLIEGKVIKCNKDCFTIQVFQSKSTSTLIKNELTAHLKPNQFFRFFCLESIQKGIYFIDYTYTPQNENEIPSTIQKSLQSQHEELYKKYKTGLKSRLKSDVKKEIERKKITPIKVENLHFLGCHDLDEEINQVMTRTLIGKCPICGANVYLEKFAASCERYEYKYTPTGKFFVPNTACKFNISKKIKNVTISDEDLIRLVNFQESTPYTLPWGETILYYDRFSEQLKFKKAMSQRILFNQYA